MNAKQIDSVLLACGEEPRDFSNEEMQFISENSALRDDILFWFESTASDGCWTENNVCFLRKFYTD